MTDRIPKYHTPEYIHLKKVASILEECMKKAQTHSPRTIDSMRRHCVVVWDAAVAHLIMEKDAKPGTINAARRRLEEAKGLLSFLPK